MEDTFLTFCGLTVYGTGAVAWVYVVLELQDMDQNIPTSWGEVLVGLRLVALVYMIL